jgi:3-oxoacyl-[acyl-carrier-protein] synthase-3
MVDTNDEWIVERTGIKERRIAAEHEATSDLAIKAGLDALENAGIKAEDLDLIIVATVTPDMAFPATACLVQKALGAPKATCFDVSAACSGFLYGMELARQFIATGSAEKALVIGADKLSAIIDWTDRNTCVLFGDGAGAAVLQPAGEGTGEILSAYSGSNGSLDEILNVPGGGSRQPPAGRRRPRLRRDAAGDRPPVAAGGAVPPQPGRRARPAAAPGPTLTTQAGGRSG